jgi:hypothetical protein
MGKHTTPADGTLVSWFEVAVETWSDLGRGGQKPSGEQLASALAARLGAEVRIVAGWLQGVARLASYAVAEPEPEESAIEEERRSVQTAFSAVRPLLEARLQQRLERVDAAASEIRCLGCGQVAQSQGDRTRQWQSTVGALELTRRYCWCQPCGQGRAAAEQPVGLPPGDYTANLEEVCALMATTVPHGMAVSLVRQLLGIEISVKGVEQISERRGRGVLTQQDADARALQPYQPNGLPQQVARPADAVGQAPQVAYLELDGVIVMRREALPMTAAAASGGRGGKGRQYQVSGREVKNAVLYDGAQCLPESDSRNCIWQKHYLSHLGEWQQLALLAWAQMRRLRFDQAKLLVVISDGAEWIRQLCAWLPIPVLLILDLFHVKKRIWELAHALYGEQTPQARQWAEVQCHRVEEGQAQAVLKALRLLKPKQAKARELVDSLVTYLTNNLDRMDYPRYRAEGLRIGSGTVESANYHVTGARLKLPGMRWSEQGAAAMARLRSDLFNGIWETRTRQLLKAA